MTGTGRRECPRCQGFVVNDDDELVCLNCGWRKYPTYNGEVVKPFSKEEMQEIIEEFGPPVEGLFEETCEDPLMRYKTMAKETALKAVKKGGKAVRRAQRRHTLGWPVYEPRVAFCLS